MTWYTIFFPNTNRGHLDNAGTRQDGGACFLLKLHPAIGSYVIAVLALGILAIVHSYLIDIFYCRLYLMLHVYACVFRVD